MSLPPLFRTAVLAAAACLLPTPLLALEAPDAVVTFNELNYNPAGSQDDEWLELTNQMAVSIDLSGWSLADGIAYTFPEGTVIPAGGYLVVAKTPSSPSLSGAGQVLGPYTGNLSNSGETIDLLSRSGRLMDRCTYSDTGEWPVAADGAGPTLSKKIEGLASLKPASWRPSLQTGGTPGKKNFPDTRIPFVTQLAGISSSWKVYDQATAPPAGWNALAFDDSAWRSGQPPFATEGAAVTPVLSDNGALVERFRAGAITGVANGATFTTWPDIATGDGLSQNGTAHSDPFFKSSGTANGQPTVSFDGTDRFTTTPGPGIAPNAGFVYFVVCKASGPQADTPVTDGGGSFLWDRDPSAADNPLVSLKAVNNGYYGFQKRYDDGSSLGGPVSITPISTDKFQIVAIRRNIAASRFEIWVDGVMEGSSPDNGQALTPQPIVIGRHASNTSGGFNGEIAELLIYKDALSDSDFSSTGSYLSARYGITSSFPDYTAKTTLAAGVPVSYFRDTFTFTGNPAKTTLQLDSTVADGAAFYLNGQEISRTNLPAGPAGQGTTALTDLPSPLSSGYLTVPSSALVQGNNVLAVSLHGSASNPASYFNARLKALETPPDPNLPPDLQINEATAINAPAFFVEIRNASAADIATAGYHLKSLGATPYDYALPSTTLPSGGFITIADTQLGGRPADGDKLVLVRPDGSLADVQPASLILRGRSPLYPDQWLYPASATPGGANAFNLQQDIVINEICYSLPDVTTTSGDKQWLELTNKGPSTIDLSGWKFGAAITYTFPAGTTLAPGAFLAVSKSPSTLLADHPGIAVTGPYSGSLSGKGERILLLDANDNPADEVSYLDGGRWPETPDGGGTTLELRDVRADNNLPESWAPSNEIARRSWQTYTYTGVANASRVGPDGQWNDFILGMLDEGEVLLDDIKVIENPGSGSVPLISNGDFESGSTGWRFLGNHSHATIITDPFNPGNKVLDLKATGSTEHMHNHVETTLAGGRSIVNGRTYQISFRACWLSGSNQLNTRLYFNRLPRTTLLQRRDDPGTPGAPNSTAVPNAGPTFLSFQHSPAVPAAGQPVTITAKVQDPDGIGSMTVFRSIAGSAYDSFPMSAGADGQTFTAALPGLPAGSIVRFYVAATDAAISPATALFPAAGEEGHALYQVEDGQAATNGLHNLRIIMTPADKALMYQTTNLMSNDRIGCTVISDENDIYYNANVRLKSSERGRGDSARVGFNLGFNDDQLFRGAHTTIAIDRSEGGITGCQEILYDQMMYAAGGISSEFNDLVKVMAPDPADSSPGILQMARFGNTFLDSTFENGADGTVYEYELIYYPLTADSNGYKLPQPDNVIGTPVTSLGDDKENYRLNWITKNNEDADDYTRVIAMCKLFDLSGAAFDAAVDNVLDVDLYLAGEAFACATGAGDSYYANNQHNGQFYARPSDGRMMFFPHDQDLGFDPNRGIYDNTELQKLIVNPARKRTYLNHLYYTCTKTFNQTYMAPWAAQFGSLLPGQDFSAHLSYINSRSNYILGAIGSDVAPVPFAITTNGGANFSTANSPAILEGKGWIDVKNIRLAGSTVPLTVTWTSINTWQLSLPLSSGSNLVALEAVDLAGHVVGTASITINYTGSIQLPTDSTLVISEIYYNPPGSDETSEYIELMNIGSATLDLSGVNFSAGLTFTFPSGYTLTAGARTLVVKDQASFATKFGSGLPVAGVYPNNLSNSGETLTLRSSSGAIIKSFAYSDQPPWPTAADGDGYTLVLVDPLANPDPSKPSSWRASVSLGGSPGTGDTQSYAAWKAANGNLPDDGDADGDGITNRAEYFLGGNPAVAEPSLRPAFTFAANGDLQFSITRRAAAEGTPFTPQISTDLTTWTAVDPAALTTTVRLPGGTGIDRLTYKVTKPANATRFFSRLLLAP